VTSRDTAQQLSLLADTYCLTCDIVMRDTAAVAADSDSVAVLTDITGGSQSDTHNQVITQLRLLQCMLTKYNTSSNLYSAAM